MTFGLFVALQWHARYSLEVGAFNVRHQGMKEVLRTKSSEMLGRHKPWMRPWAGWRCHEVYHMYHGKREKVPTYVYSKYDVVFALLLGMMIIAAMCIALYSCIYMFTIYCSHLEAFLIIIYLYNISLHIISVEHKNQTPPP